MKNLSKLFVFSISLFSVIVFAQEQEKLPARTKTPEFQQKVAVNYVLIDVVVTDREGRYVRNLAKEDFILYENKKQVEIESLDEFQMLEELEIVREESLPTADSIKQPPRNIILFFDNSFSSIEGRKQGIAAAEHFVLNRIQPGDRVMILMYSNSLRTIQPFTADKEKVIESMRKFGLTSSYSTAGATDTVETAATQATETSQAGAGGESGEMGAEIESESAAAEAQAVRMEYKQRTRNYILSLEALAKVVKYYPGRKTLILLSQGLGGYPQPDYQKMIEDLNDAQVSVYTINVGGLQPVGNASGRSWERRSVTDSPGPEEQLQIMRGNQDFLSVLSNDTGGRAYFNKNDLVSLFNKVDVDISNYYILGYRSQFDVKKSQFRKIQVKTKNREYKVLHRKGFNTPRPFTSLSKDERDLHLTEGFLTRSQINGVEAEVGYQFIRTSPSNMKACITILIPRESLEAQKNRVELEVLVSNLDANAKIFNSVHKKYLVEDAANPELAQKGIRIVENLNSVLGLNRLRVAIRDNNTGKRSYFYNNYILRESDSTGIFLSQPIYYDPNDCRRFEEDFKVNAELLENWNEPPTGVADPLEHPDLGKIYPAIEPSYGSGDTVHLFTLLYNLGRDLSDQAELKWQAAVSPTPAAGQEREYFGVTLSNMKIHSVAEEKHLIISADFQLGALEPGSYDLFILAQDSRTGRQAAAASRFHVIK